MISLCKDTVQVSVAFNTKIKIYYTSDNTAEITTMIIVS
jgi:hypothetical protein